MGFAKCHTIPKLHVIFLSGDSLQTLVAIKGQLCASSVDHRFEERQEEARCRVYVACCHKLALEQKRSHVLSSVPTQKMFQDAILQIDTKREGTFDIVSLIGKDVMGKQRGLGADSLLANARRR